MELEAYSQAVKYYNATSGILLRYKNLPSFHSIHQDCVKIMEDLQIKLRNIMTNGSSSSPQVTESVLLLLELGGSAKSLCSEYLQR